MVKNTPNFQKYHYHDIECDMILKNYMTLNETYVLGETYDIKRNL